MSYMLTDDSQNAHDESAREERNVAFHKVPGKPVCQRAHFYGNREGREKEDVETGPFT